MFMLGTLVNVAAILVASALGSFLKKGISERVRKTVTSALALAVIFIGITGALDGYADFTAGSDLFSKYGMLVIILSLALGAAIGEAIDIDRALSRLGAYLEGKLTRKREGEDTPSTFATGFVNCTLLFCVGAMAILGAIEDTGAGTPNILLSKALLDGMSALMLSATFGIGCAFSALPVLLYQGLFSVLALFALDGVPAPVMGALSATGSLIIVVIGLNMLGATKVKTANLLPAVFLPLLTVLLL